MVNCNCRHNTACSEKKVLNEASRKIMLVGNPNVGKSVLFSALTGKYAVVSNYPGTTVEVTRGTARVGSLEFEVVDTPGMYSLLPISEEERVARNILLEEKPSLVLHVIDAKNLARMLGFTLQLIETGLPVLLVLNMMDELKSSGDVIDIPLLEQELKIPVTGVTAISGQGMDMLRGRIEEYVNCCCQ